MRALISGQAAERGSTLAFQVMAFLAPVLGMVAPLGEAPLVTFGGAGILMLNLAHGRAPRAPQRYVVLFGALVAISLLSCLWTIDLSLTASRAIRLFAEVLIGFALVDRAGRIHAEGRRLVIVSLIAGMTLAAVIVLTDAVLSHRLVVGLWPARPSITQFDRGGTTLVVLAWPVLIYLAGLHNRRFAAAIGLSVAVVVWYLLSDSAKLAYGAGLVVAAAVYWGGDRLARPLRILLPLGILIMPLIAISLPAPEVLIRDRPVAKVSALHRLVIWQFTGQRILERPLLGWGMETSRDLPGANNSYAIEATPGAPPMVALSLHPHNGALQIWVELGVFGALLGGGLLLLVTREGIDLSGSQQAGFYGGLTAVLVIAMLSFGVWQSWWDEELWLFAALMRLVLGDRQGAA